MNKLLSLIVPVFNEEEVLPVSYARMSAAMQALTGYDYEIIYVNDGSRDGTMKQLRAIAKEHNEVRVISFSRNFGHQLAVTAGMDNARGDALIIIDADLQDPPEVIAELVKAWENGADIAYGKRLKREGETVFLKMREHNRFLRGMSGWMGFDAVPVEYVRHERQAGKTKYTLKKMLRLAFDGILGFSYKPMSLALYAGAALGATGMLGLIALIIIAATIGCAPWLWAVDGLVLINALTLAAIGVQGAYLNRIYDEVRGRPLYIAAETINLDR